jgi:hypothetical protein
MPLSVLNFWAKLPVGEGAKSSSLTVGSLVPVPMGHVPARCHKVGNRAKIVRRRTGRETGEKEAAIRFLAQPAIEDR